MSTNKQHTLSEPSPESGTACLALAWPVAIVLLLHQCQICPGLIQEVCLISYSLRVVASAARCRCSAAPARGRGPSRARRRQLIGEKGAALTRNIYRVIGKRALEGPRPRASDARHDLHLSPCRMHHVLTTHKTHTHTHTHTVLPLTPGDRYTYRCQ